MTTRLSGGVAVEIAKVGARARLHELLDDVEVASPARSVQRRLTVNRRLTFNKTPLHTVSHRLVESGAREEQHPHAAVAAHEAGDMQRRHAVLAWRVNGGAGTEQQTDAVAIVSGAG
eukprot:scaffold40909_cov73-Phaeocystis_antarctica.AAC.6